MSALVEAPPAPVEAGRAVRLCLRGLSVTLAGRVILDDVGFDIDVGAQVGILGPATSGKSVLLQCLSGARRPERGTARLDGDTLVPTSRSGRARVGISLATSTLDLTGSARTNLLQAAQRLRVPRGERRRRASELLSYFGLSADDGIEALTPGARRAVELARALIQRPDLLLIDTPANLDVPAGDPLWDRLDAIRGEQELSVVVATRSIELARRCDHLVILDRGHVIASEPPAHLINRVGGDVIEIAADQPEGLMQDIAAAFDVSPRRAGEAVILEVDCGHELVPRLVDVFPAGRFAAITLRRPSLADAFFHLTGRSLLEPNAS